MTESRAIGLAPMCGRYTLTHPSADLSAEFELELGGELAAAPRYNIAPTQPVPIILERTQKPLARMSEIAATDERFARLRGRLAAEFADRYVRLNELAAA